MTMKKALLFLLMTTPLFGCVSQDYTDTQAETDAVHQTITRHTSQEALNKVSRISTPPVSIVPLVETVYVPWLQEEVSVSVVDLPLSLVVSQIMEGVTANVWFDGDVDPNLRVTLAYKGRRGDVLNMLARQTDYGITPLAHKLEIRKFISETFTVTLPTGKYSGQLGSQGNQAPSDSGTGGSPRVEGQFVNVEYSEVDVFDEIGRGIEALLSEGDGKTVGQVRELPSLSIVSVRTSPSRMQQVRSFVQSYQRELSKQVLLDIQVLEFNSTLGKERGIDWNVIKDIGEGTLQFFVPGTSTVSNGAGYGLAFQGTGKWDGTTAFIRALEKQGSVSTQTPITGLVLNNQPSKIAQTTTTPFLSEVKSQANDNVVSTSITRDKVTTGVDMMVTPNVQDGSVWLRIAGKLSKIIADDKEKVNDIKLRFLTTQESEFTFTNKLRYGQTYVIASVKQQTKLAEKKPKTSGPTPWADRGRHTRRSRPWSC